MITYALLWYIGVNLAAPTWYFVITGVGFVFKLFSFGLSMYKAGAKK